MAVNPNRPTFATPAQTTAPGQLELETGLLDSLDRDGGRTAGTPTLLKWGLGRDVELRLASPGWLRLRPSDSPAAQGPGDLGLGVQWCVRHQGWLGMDYAIQAAHTFPTASAARGLGNGAPIDLLMLLGSRDLGAWHLDLNALENFVGQPGAPARLRQPAATAALSRSLTEAWSLTGEVYAIGGTGLGPRVVSNLWAVGYKVSPGLVLDASVDVGLTRGAPKLTAQAGLTVALGRVRPWF